MMNYITNIRYGCEQKYLFDDVGRELYPICWLHIKR